MATRAVAQIKFARVYQPGCFWPGDKPQNPGHHVGIDIKDAGGGVECRAAPFAAAVKPRKDDRPLQAGRNELASVPKLAQVRQHRLVGRRRPVRHNGRGEFLARKRRGQQREGLCGRRLFALNV